MPERKFSLVPQSFLPVRGGLRDQVLRCHFEER